MSTLWTPYGEVNPEKPSGEGQNQDSAAEAGITDVPADADPNDIFAGMSEEEKQAALEQITKMRAELLSTPARDVIGNHIVGFYELASVHLSEAAQAQGAEKEQRLAEASLCIDAMAAVVNGLSDRLDAHAEPLHAALAQMQMAFAQVKNGEASD
jgi:hypothetical protein